MTTKDPIPRVAGEHETNSTVSYDDYRILCDELQPEVYRKTGVESRDNYDAAQADERTVLVEIDGHRIPLLVPLEHVGGYNVEGTRKLTERENVYALTLPLEFIEDRGVDLNAYLEALGDNSAVIVQTPSERSQEIKSKMNEELTNIDGWAIHEFIDPDVRDKSRETANVTIYYADFEARDQEDQPIPRNNLSMRELYDQEVEEFGETDTRLVEAAEIRNNEQLFEELWELHDEKFDWLGRFHPLSMQEDKEFFKLLLSDDRTSSLVRYTTNEDGERVVVGHGIALEGSSLVDWIAEHARQDIEQTARERGDARVVFYYGIDTRESKEEDTKYGEDIMRLLSRLMNRGGGKVLLVFESTNVSSQYIPYLIHTYNKAEPRGVKEVSPSVPQSTLDYWALKSPSKVTM